MNLNPPVPVHRRYHLPWWFPFTHPFHGRWRSTWHRLMYRLGWVPVESFNQALEALQRKDRMVNRAHDDYDWLVRELPRDHPVFRESLVRPHWPYGSTT